MLRNLPAGAVFGLGCLAVSILALLLLRANYFTDEILLPLLIGALGSVLATTLVALATLFSSGIVLPFKILNSQEIIYKEATSIIQELNIRKTGGDSVLVTAMIRKETKADDADVRTYMAATDQLLRKAGQGEETIYRMMGQFKDRNEVEERLQFFNEEQARKHLRLASFDEAWPVDVLVAGTRKVIVAFRSHGTGKLSWAILVNNKAFSKRMAKWLNDLWFSQHTKEVWNGKKILCS